MYTFLDTPRRRPRSLSFDIASLQKSSRHITNETNGTGQRPFPMNRSKSALVSQSSILLQDSASLRLVIGTATGTSEYFASKSRNNGNIIDSNNQDNEDNTVCVHTSNNGANGSCQRSGWLWRKIWLQEATQIVFVSDRDNTVSGHRVALFEKSMA